MIGPQQMVFGWIDYGLFSGLLGLSLLIGVYFGFFSKQDTTSEYLFGGKTMNYVPVAVSILASFLSGITFLGYPTEVYLHGSQYYAAIVSAAIIGLTSAYVTLPVLFELRVSSCYEYLELRFSREARTFASVLYIIALFLYIPVVVYVPALAFSQVTGYNVHTITPIFSIVCITYTSMGGVKAVVWTDTIQFAFTVLGLSAVLLLGLNSIGGLSEVWRIADEGGRLKFFDLDPSPLRRDTFWAMAVGLTTSMLSRFGLGQKFVQRFLAIEKESDMRRAVSLVSIGWGVLQVSCVFTGLIIYAEYHDCDPLKAKMIKRSDQILPHYVMDVAGHVPGLPGIFLAGLVSSGLSTMSASLNTQSALIYETFVDSWIPESPKKESKAANIMKGLSLLVGLITIGMIFLVEQLGTVFELGFSLSGATEGTLLGLLLLGLLFPWVGKIGALTGACASLVVMLLYVGMNQWYTLHKRIRVSTLPTSVANCSLRYHLGTFDFEPVTEPPLDPADEPAIFFQVAVIYFTLIGSVIAIVIGCLTSYFLGEMDTSSVKPEHISPIIRRFVFKRAIYNEVQMKDIDAQDAVISEKSEKTVY